MTPVVLLDNEAVQVLGETSHRNHRAALSHVQVVAGRKRRGADVRVIVPTAVRVEAGWVRTAPSWAFANRLRITDTTLDTAAADVAAAICASTAVSITDAHLGAAIRSRPADRVTVLASDPDDVGAVDGDVVAKIVRF